MTEQERVTSPIADTPQASTGSKEAVFKADPTQPEVIPLHHVLKRSNIRSRLLTAFTSVVLLTVVVIAVTSSVLSIQNQQEQAKNQLETTATLKEAQINTWIKNVQLDLSSLLSNPDDNWLAIGVLAGKVNPSHQSRTFVKLRANFQRVVAQTEQFEEVFIVHQNGKIFLSTNEAQEGKLQSSEAYFKEGLKGPYVQSPRYVPELHQVVIIFSQPIREPTGKVWGVVAGRANLTRLYDILSTHAGLGNTTETYLLALDQSLLTPSLLKAQYPVGQTSIQTQGANLAVKEHVNGSGMYDNYAGVPVIGVYHWLPQLQAVLLAEQGQAEVFSATYTILGINIGVAVVALLVAIIAGLLLTQSIAGPLANLAETARQITDGNLKLTARVERADEIGDLAEAFNSMTAQLRGLIDNLEERVNQRTHALQTSAEISRQVAGILDLNELLESIVNLIQTEFKFYHTHIYLLDEATESLVMTEGSGEVGRQLKAQGHKLRLGQGIVGNVAASGQAFLIGNVDTASNFFRNPLLPKTQSELAVPLQKGEKILGVLDIQSEELDAFTQADLTLMQSIANQVAIAVDNARLFWEAQSTVAEVEALNRRLTHEVWRDISKKVYSTGYVFTHTGLNPAPTEWIPPMTEAVQQKQLVNSASNGNGSAGSEPLTSLAIPLTLRGEVIGVIGIERSTAQLWSQDELITVQTVVEQVALALDAARLAQETERAAWRDRVVGESTAKVWSSSEMEEVLRVAVAQLGDKLGASEVVIRLGTAAELTREE